MMSNNQINTFLLNFSQQIMFINRLFNVTIYLRFLFDVLETSALKTSSVLNNAIYINLKSNN